MITVWLILIVVFLVAEMIFMELYGACGAVGALAGLIAGAFGLSALFQIPIAIVVAIVLIVAARPIGMKYIARMKRENRMQDLVGSDAIVICAIDNSQGVGMVTINGKQFAARSHRPNAVIKEGNVVKVVAMKSGTAIVDDRKRNNR